MASKAKSTALTTEEKKEAAALAELGAFFDSQIDVDGMADVGGEDIKLAVKLFNMGGVDGAGNSRLKNEFFDNVTEETQSTIECVILLTQKTNRWDVYDNAAKETNVICDSQDRVIGKLREDNTERACKGCKDTGWFKDPKTGDPMRKCGEVHNVVCIEEGGRPFIIRYKKTGLSPFRNYLMRHHFNARQKADGTRGHFPLFAFRCTMALVMHASGNYAIPTLTRGAVLSQPDMVAMHESAKGYLEMMGQVLDHADNVDQQADSEVDPNFAADDFTE